MIGPRHPLFGCHSEQSEEPAWVSRGRSENTPLASRDTLSPMRRLAFLLLLTTSATAQWQLQTSNTTASLRGIHAVTDQIAWASGTSGTILHTIDGGQHWLPCTTPPAAEHLDFRGIQAFDATTAIVMSSGKGDLSRLYKTTDTCQSWTLVFTNPDQEGFWDAISFADLNQGLRDPRWEGILIGDPVSRHFVIFTSSDLGQSWHRLMIKHDAAKRKESLFAASNSAAESIGRGGNLAFVTGGESGSYFYREDPGGLVLDQFMTIASLDRVSLPFPHASMTQGAFSVSKRQLNGGNIDVMIVGGDYSKPEEKGYAAFLPTPTYGFFMEHQKVERTLLPTPRLPLRRSLLPHPQSLDHRRPQRHRPLHR